MNALRNHKTLGGSAGMCWLLLVPSLLLATIAASGGASSQQDREISATLANGFVTFVSPASVNWTEMDIYRGSYPDNSTPYSVNTQGGTHVGFTPGCGQICGAGVGDRFWFRFVAGPTNHMIQVRKTGLNDFADWVIDTPLSIAVGPAITTQPANQAVTAGAIVSFTNVPSGTPAPTLQWQVSINGGGSWSDLADNTLYFGVTTPVLFITGATITLNGYQYRCVVSNSAGSINSSAAVLTVNPAPPGSVVAWGNNASGQTDVPVGLRGVVAIAGGGQHTVALKSDGTVVAWGYNDQGQTTVPVGLVGVAAIAGGGLHTVALKSNGTVVAWGYNGFGQTDIPVGLSGVTAIAAGAFHTVALKGDGTVVAWGLNADGQATVPAGLSGVTSIAAGYNHTVALKRDGTVVAWGWNADGRTNTPVGLSGVTAIAAGGSHTLALVNGIPVPPDFGVHPQSRTVTKGANVTFSASASGTLPMSYQWLFNNAPIPGATSSTLTLNNVQPGSAGRYSLRAVNAVGSVTSQAATLTVLADPANGTPPSAPSYRAIPSKPVAKDSLVVITHGWQRLNPFNVNPEVPDVSWIDRMADSIRARVPANWQVETHNWVDKAWQVLPDTALSKAVDEGRKMGRIRAGQNWSHVHLIGHSAGSMLIQSACEALKEASQPPTVHTTFLDPYMGVSDAGRVRYGAGADWSDSYFAHDFTDKLLTSSTEGAMPNAFNVDVTWLDPNRRVTELFAYSSSALALPGTPTPVGYQALSAHDWPHDFYHATVVNGFTTAQGDPSLGYGYPLSKEGGGWDNRASYQRGLAPGELGSMPSVPRNVFPLRVDSRLSFSLIPSATSAGGTVQLNSGGFSLSTGALAPLPPAGSLLPQSIVPAEVGTPVWLSVGVTVSNQVNFVSFDGLFTSGTGAAGLLTVYWNTNQIGVVDEGVAAAGTRSYTFALPGAFDPGNYTLGFRLDPFSATTSSVAVTNVVTGFSGLTNAMTMSLTPAGTNATPSLRVTGASGYNYLVEATTNFVTWEPVATLVNTNGAVDFVDTRTTNFIRRFYRAVLP